MLSVSYTALMASGRRGLAGRCEHHERVNGSRAGYKISYLLVPGYRMWRRQSAEAFHAFKKAVNRIEPRSRVSRHVWTLDVRAARIRIHLDVHMVQWSAV